MSRLSRLALSVLLLVGAVLLGAIAVLVLLVGVAAGGGSSPIVTFAVAVLASEAGFLVTGIAFLATEDAGDLAPGFDLPGARGWLTAAGATLGLVACNRLAFFVGGLVGIDPVASVSMPAELRSVSFLVVAAALFVVVVGPVEEFFFRGVLQRYLRGAFSTAGAVGWTTVLFFLVHVPNVQAAPEAILISGPLWLLLGLVFGWLYERTDTLVVPAATHSVYNICVFGLALTDVGV